MLKLWECRRSVASEFFRLDYNFARFSKNLTTAGGYTESDHAAARQWLAKFHIQTIPRELGEVTFSRSSGPGGQNVNKYGSTCKSMQEDMEFIIGRLNSKATARFHMKDLLSIVPRILHEPLRKSQYYARKSECLVIQADFSRKQRYNVNRCFWILYDIIKTAGRKNVKGETSLEQKAKVEELYVRFFSSLSH